MTLRPKTPSYFGDTYERKLLPARLFLDDIAEIHAMLDERAGGALISVGDRETEKAEDLKGASRSLKSVTIDSNDPRIRVWLSSKRVWIHGHDDGAKQVAVDVADLINVRSSFRARISWPIAFILASMVIQVAALALSLVRASYGLATYGVITLVGMAAFTVYLMYVNPIARIRIVPYFRGEHRALSRQDRQNWLIGVSTGVLGVALGAVIGHFWK